MKIRLIIFTIICCICGTFDVFADNQFTISGPSSANYNQNFDISIKYSGTNAGSMRLGVTMTNGNCSVKSKYSNGQINCTGSNCDAVFQAPTEEGIKSGTTLLTLTCKSTNESVLIKAFLQSGDAWSVDGLSQLSISSSSKKITINKQSTTTTTKKTTTTTKSATTKTTTKKTATKPLKDIPTTTTKEIQETTTQTIVDIATTTSTNANNNENNIIGLIPEDMKLSKLKIVGYPIAFDANRTSYTINISNKVDEVYILAEPIDKKTIVENIGIVNIYGKSVIIVKVYNEKTKNKLEYKIYIEREKINEPIIDFIINNSKLIILFGSLLVFIAIIILALIGRKYNKSTGLEKIDNIYIEHTLINKEKTKGKFIDIPETEEDLEKLFSDINKEK